ncbi:MAG: Hsp20/alpha crystallin family protein [Cytophagales bacterium]|nr:Hsp20/alpha crystallin family protein [Bernardetiaceae bacterium]MDW8210789.1 Hsp20/alpha crystallin family protein [Cytophagales bacterium]
MSMLMPSFRFPSLMSDLFNIEKFFNEAFQLPTLSNAIPAVNVKEDEAGFYMEVAAPGMEKSDFKVQLTDNVLTISAEKKKEKKEEDKNYTRREFNYTSFKRSFTLPENVDKDNIKAEYNNGILHVSIPKIKKEESTPKGREIEVG